MSYLIKNYVNDINKSIYQPLLIELSKNDIKRFGDRGYEKSILIAKEIYNESIKDKYKDSTNLLFIDGDTSSTDGSIILLEKLLEYTSKQIQLDKNYEIIKSIGKGVFSYFSGGVLKEYFGEYIDKGINELNDLFSDIIDDTVENSLEFLFDEGTGKLTDIVSDIAKDKLNDIVNKKFYLSKNSIDKLSNLTAQFKENSTPLEIFSNVLQFILYTAIDSKKVIFINNPHKLDKDSISIISLLLSLGKDLKEKYTEQNEKKSYHTGISIVYCYNDKNFQPYSSIDKKYEEIKLLLDDQRRFAQRYAMIERPSSDIPNIAVKSSTFVGREVELKKLYYRFDISKKDKNFKNIEVISADPGIGKTKLIKKHLEQIQKFEKNGKRIIQLTLLNQVGHNSSNSGLTSLKESIVNEAKRLDSLKTFEETSVEKIKDFAKDQILNSIENLLGIDNIIEVGESIYEAGSFEKNSNSFINKSKENINDKNEKTKEQEFENIRESILKLQELSDEFFPIVLFIDDLQWIDEDSAEFVLKYFTNTYKINPYLVTSLRASDANTSLDLALENKSFNKNKIELLKQVGITSERPSKNLYNATKLDINKINLEGLNEDNLFELISKTIQGNKEQSRLLSQNIIKQLNPKESKAVNTLFAIETINLLCDEKFYRNEKEFSLNNKLVLQNPLRLNQELKDFEQVLDETFQILDKKYKTAFEHINSEQDFEQKFNLMTYAVFEERLYILKVYFKEYGNAAINTLLLSSLLGAPFNSDIVKTIIEELSKTEKPLLQPLRKELINQSNQTLEGFHYDIIEEVYEILSRYVLFDNTYEYKHNLLEIFLEKQLDYTLDIIFDKKNINDARNVLYQIVLDKLYSNAKDEGVYLNGGYNLEKAFTKKSKYLFFSILMENRILKRGYIINKKLWANEYIHSLNDISLIYLFNYEYEKCLNFSLEAVKISSYIYSINKDNDEMFIHHNLYYKSLKTLADIYFKFQYYNECINICNKTIEHLKKLPMDFIHKIIKNPFKKIIHLLILSLIETNRNEEIKETEEKYKKYIFQTNLSKKMKKDEKFHFFEGKVSSLEFAETLFNSFDEKESYLLTLFNRSKRKYKEQGIVYIDMYLKQIEDLIKFYRNVEYDDFIIKYIKIKCDLLEELSLSSNEKNFINKYIVALLELANYYKQKKDTKKTIEVYKKTLTALNRFQIVLEKKTEFYSIIYNNLSGQYKIINDLKNALYYQEKAVDYIYILSENNYEWSKSYIIALDNLYRLYEEDDNHNKSFEYFSRMMETLEKLYSPSLKDQWLTDFYIKNLHHMISLFIENDNLEHALFYTELIYSIAVENSYTDLKIQKYANNIFLIKTLINVASKYSNNRL